MDDHFYRKILRVANSVSSEEDKSRALFVLFGLLSILNKPTLYDKINKLRNKIFAGIQTIEVIHTGHDFDSTEPRPAFAIAPIYFVFIKMKTEFIFRCPITLPCASLLANHHISDPE
jgi:hypothetical protein